MSYEEEDTWTAPPGILKPTLAFSSCVYCKCTRALILVLRMSLRKSCFRFRLLFIPDWQKRPIRGLEKTD